VGVEKNFLPKRQFLEALSECALYIGSGATSFLEATYLRTPTIFIGVNHLERRFGSAIALKFGIKNIDLETDYLASSLANEIELSLNSKNLGQNLNIDLNGVDRILDLVMSL
jgi:spore coat polysaccharide biosynthesis predicted glycosyltransferase SpsG